MTSRGLIQSLQSLGPEKSGFRKIGNDAAAEITRIHAELDSAKKAIAEIVRCNNEFVIGMPEIWEGDPLQDAIDAAKALFAH